MRAMFSDARVSGPWLALGAIALLAGCASRPGPKPDEPAAYAAWTCDQLADGIDAVQERAADVAYAVDARVGNNMIALGQGVAVFWPGLLAWRPSGRAAAAVAPPNGGCAPRRWGPARRRCGAPHAAAQAITPVMPVELGDRLVYENRPGHRGAAHELGMRVSALRRDQLEFILDLDGHALPQRWQQDLAGNPTMAVARMDHLIGWRRLLRRDLQLGQVLTGELASPHESVGAARVRGQVVAIGPQRIDDRMFDVAVIELFGDVPTAGGSTRLDGVMSVDRRSGVLLRLELRCDNASYALRRRLVRVEASAGG